MWAITECPNLKDAANKKEFLHFPVPKKARGFFLTDIFYIRPCYAEVFDILSNKKKAADSNPRDSARWLITGTP
jgi:hypothetical protein